jgi:hypothetical protein
MLHNFETTLHEKDHLNPRMRLWCKTSISIVLNLNLSEYIKLAEIIVIQVIGLVENEQTFNIVAFMKNKLCNHLGTHLVLCIRFHSQQFFILQIILYDQAIAKWQYKVHYCANA